MGPGDQMCWDGTRVCSVQGKVKVPNHCPPFLSPVPISFKLGKGSEMKAIHTLDFVEGNLSGRLWAGSSKQVPKDAGLQRQGWFGL